MPNKPRIGIALDICQPFPHHQDVLAGIQAYTRDHPGWECIIDEHPTYLADGKTGHYDGVIARASPDLQKRLSDLQIPLVNVWHQHARPEVAGVYIDTQAVGQLAADHLIDRGFRRLAYLGIKGHAQSVAIGESFAKYVTERRRTCHLQYMAPDDCVDREYWIELRELLDAFMDGLTPPAGIVVAIPWIARLLMSLSSTRGWGVPMDLAVISWDNIKSIVELPPQITCIDSGFDRIGYEAAALLSRLMAGDPVPQRPTIVPPRGILTRESTDYFAVEDEVVAEALNYISRHLSEPLRVDDIAYEVAVSPRSLQRRFESALGRPISDEIRRLRLALAKRMLSEKQMQINQIARATGFNSPVTMNLVFKRELGISPSAYRKQMLHEQA